MILLIQSMTDPTKRIVFDAVLEELHTHRTLVTDYTVEDGYNASDNAKPEAPTFSIKGFVSDTPMNATPSDMSLVKFDMILEMAGHGASAPHPLKVVTTVKTYDNAFLIDVSNPAVLGGIDFSLQFKVVRKVSTVFSNNRKLQDRASKTGVPTKAASKVDTGKQAPTAVKPTTPKQSLLFQGLSKIGVF